MTEELFQETFFKLFKSIHAFKGHSKVSSWQFERANWILFTIT